MSVTTKEIEKLSNLAQIAVNENEKQELAEKMGKILDWMEVLNEVNTKGVPPLQNVHDGFLEMAADEISDGDKAEEILKNAPDEKYGYFAVPKVIE